MDKTSLQGLFQLPTVKRTMKLLSMQRRVDIKVSITYGKANYIVHIVDLLDSRFQLPTVKRTAESIKKSFEQLGFNYLR